MRLLAQALTGSKNTGHFLHSIRHRLQVNIKMKSYYIESYIKSLDELPDRLTDKAPEPKTGPNDVVVDVYSAALNFFDILQLQGKYQNQPPFPWNAGAEFAGVISPSSPIPKGCNFVPGKTRVFGASQGAYAERISADWRNLVIVPEGMSFEAASSLFVTYPTSYAGLVTRANLKKGETCLIHAGAGGVGLCAIQIAKALGATVIATAGSAEKLKICKEKGGADYAIDYTDKNWPTKVKELTKGKGVDVIYDPVGMILPSLKCIAWNGRAVVVGFAAGSIEKIPMNLVLLKNISIVGVHWGAYTRNQPEHIPEVWAALLQLIREGQLRPVVFEKVYEGLPSLPEGLKDLANRKTWGKAVLRIRSDTSDSSRQSKL